MKNVKKSNRGTTFVLLLIIILVVGLWIVTVADLTTTSSQLEGRRVSFSLAVATADAGLERAFARYAEITQTGGGAPTPTEMMDGWDDADRAPDYQLNPGVSMGPEDVNIFLMDGLGRIYRNDVEADTDMVMHKAYDAFSQKPVERIGIVASAKATVANPIGATGEPLTVTVNRVYNINDGPFPDAFAAYMTHMLYLHAGPDMYIDGPIYSTTRVFGQTNNTTKIADDITTPPNFPKKRDANGEYIGADAVRQALQDLIDAGREDEIEGFFYNEEIHGIFKDQGNGVELLDGVRHITRDKFRYVFDTNNEEFWKWFGDTNGDGLPDNAWKTSDNPNINGGYREMIERRDSNAGYDESVFISSKRMDNYADLKIYYDSSVENFANADGTINPDAVQIYYNKNYHWDAPDVPSDPNDPGYDAAVKKAIAYYEEKALVPNELKTQILATMEYQPYSVTTQTTTDSDGSETTEEIHDGFFDKWLDIDHGIGGLDNAGQMNLVNFDVEELNEVLESWSSGTMEDIDYTQFEYLPNEKDANGKLKDNKLRGYVLYVTDEASNPDLDAANPDFSRGIRLRNGSEVADGGLVVATDLMAYVEGDYNTGGKGNQVQTNSQNDGDPSNEEPYNTSSDYRPGDHPSALFADSIRLLSRNWDDDDSYKDISHRRAKHTTYNLTMVMGDRYLASTQHDTGGLHNFPRFLENWSGREATISGAFVQLWLAHYNLYSYEEGGDWRTAYSAPNRHWRFDYNYYKTGGIRCTVQSGRNENSFGRYWMTAGN